jgi:hypothetical protein
VTSLRERGLTRTNIERAVWRVTNAILILTVIFIAILLVMG